MGAAFISTIYKFEFEGENFRELASWMITHVRQNLTNNIVFVLSTEERFENLISRYPIPETQHYFWQIGHFFFNGAGGRC